MKLLIDTQWGIGGLVLAEVLVLCSLIYLGRKTELLRDSDLKEPDFTKRPCPIARVRFLLTPLTPKTTAYE